MKHTVRGRIGLLLLGALALSLVAGCAEDSVVSDDQAQEAFIVAFGGAYVGSMAAQTGQALPGISLDAEQQAVVFDEFDVTGLQTDYQTLSGTVKTTENSATVDFTLTGGAVETIAFTVSGDQMSSEDGIVATATVNGTEMEIRIDPQAATQ